MLVASITVGSALVLSSGLKDLAGWRAAWWIYAALMAAAALLLLWRRRRFLELSARRQNA